VNHVTDEAAQEASDVMLGMFSVNSSPAIVLLDSGASHSCIAYYLSRIIIYTCVL
jgi:hypothetical protein